MRSHGRIPYLSLEFRDEQKQCKQANQRLALVATSSSQSTMEMSTYKSLFPNHSLLDDHADHNYEALTNPQKDYSLIATKLIECPFYVSDQDTEVSLKTKFYIISDVHKSAPDIVLGTNFLLDQSLVNSLTSNGIRMSDKNLTFIPYSYIARTTNPNRSITHQMLSPYKAKVRTIPTNPFHHQNFQLTTHNSTVEDVTDERQEQIASPNTQLSPQREHQYGRTNLVNTV